MIVFYSKRTPYEQININQRLPVNLFEVAQIVYSALVVQELNCSIGNNKHISYSMRLLFVKKIIFTLLSLDKLVKVCYNADR